MTMAAMWTVRDIRPKHSDDRVEPKAAGLKSRPSLVQQTIRLGQSDRHAATRPR